jgi:ribulose-bisphosphate carboxylase large chain
MLSPPDFKAADRILANYRLALPQSASVSTQQRLQSAEKMARFIAYEQTVELPEALIRDPHILQNIVGRVERLNQLDEFAFETTISYSSKLASNQLSQLVNLLYGNVSMLDGVRLSDMTLPADLTTQFKGPLHGIVGLRRLTGVYQRPLLATAVKPRGTPTEGLAKLAADFALGGGDIVKDDQNLVSSDFESFKARVDQIASAVAKANDKTGRNCLYFPHLAARTEDLERAIEFVYRSGLKGVLMCPMVLGLDLCRKLAADYGLVFMAHPAMTGAYTSGRDHGMSHSVLLGSLFRLAGADISVFPATGGRFNYAPEDCAAVCAKLTQPQGALKTTFPCPAGGITFDRVAELAQTYGQDSVLLIGGSLQAYSSDIVAGTKAYQAKIAAYFQPEEREPEPELESSCEVNFDDSSEGIRSLLSFLPDFNWSDRRSRAYKSSNELSYTDVRRVELIGKNGERADFDLRYFEIAPGGHTSLEKHLHTHVIIGARGSGILQINGVDQRFNTMDVAYVQPLEVHQLCNNSDSDFGFFCIVDRERDRPMRP